MSTREYIGARYVPKFAEPIDWNINNSYEALTIVTYHGNSFTSKKPVPTGTSLDNTEYWVATGNYNAQLEEIKQLASDASNKANLLYDRKFILIGDSYLESPSVATSWGHYIEEYFGIDVVVSLPVSGGGFWVNNANLFLNALSNASISNKDKITDIVVCGGINDIAGTFNRTNLNTAINNFCTYCKENYPNAKVRIGFIGNVIAGTTYASGYSYEKLINGIETYKNCTEYGAVYLNGVEVIMHDYRNINKNDYLHPTQDGSKALGRGIGEAIYSGSCHYVTPVSDDVVITPVTGGTIDNNLGQTCINGSIVNISPHTLRFSFADDGKTISGTSWTEIASISSDKYIFNTGFSAIAQAQITCDLEPFKLINIPMAFRVNGGKVYLRSLYINSGVWENRTVTTLYLFFDDPITFDSLKM